MTTPTHHSPRSWLAPGQGTPSLWSTQQRNHLAKGTTGRRSPPPPTIEPTTRVGGQHPAISLQEWHLAGGWARQISEGVAHVLPPYNSHKDWDTKFKTVKSALRCIFATSWSAGEHRSSNPLGSVNAPLGTRWHPHLWHYAPVDECHSGSGSCLNTIHAWWVSQWQWKLSKQNTLLNYESLTSVPRIKKMDMQCYNFNCCHMNWPLCNIFEFKPKAQNAFADGRGKNISLFSIQYIASEGNILCLYCGIVQFTTMIEHVKFWSGYTARSEHAWRLQMTTPWWLQYLRLIKTEIIRPLKNPKLSARVFWSYILCWRTAESCQCR